MLAQATLLLRRFFNKHVLRNVLRLSYYYATLELASDMALYKSEYRSKVRRDKSREAISLAMQSRWQEAAEANRSIIELFPEDIEASNRLGKALLELGDYPQARTTFECALQLSRSNIIARKNLARLDLLEKEAQAPRREAKLTSQQFLGEGGKTTITTLDRPAPGPVIARMAPGDPVNLEIEGNTLLARNDSSEYLGLVTPRLAVRLLRLMAGGNRYEAAVISASEAELGIIIRETHQSLEQMGIASFPARGVRDPGTYALAQYDLAEEEELDEAGAASYSDWDESDDEPHPSTARPPGTAVGASERDPEDEDEG